MSIIKIDVNLPITITKNKHFTHYSKTSRIVINNAKVYCGTLFNDDTLKLFFKTNKRTMNELTDIFGKRIFYLYIRNAEPFPTIITVDKKLIDYNTFIDMFQHNKIIIKQISTKVRIKTFSNHEVLLNKVCDIECEENK